VHEPTWHFLSLPQTIPEGQSLGLLQTDPPPDAEHDPLMHA